jgi:ABC-type Mn2+/Zn2+ transport system ATPase subunit
MKVNGFDQSTRAYVGAFNFKGADQQKNVGKLSGGERNRVNIAKMLKRGGNVLLLDEPTNDLDVETLGALEEAIENFAGCAVVISHDRFFLDRLATHILAFEGNSHVEWFEGNFESYEEDKRRRLGDAADRPTALAYKKHESFLKAGSLISSTRWICTRSATLNYRRAKYTTMLLLLRLRVP